MPAMYPSTMAFAAGNEPTIIDRPFSCLTGSGLPQLTHGPTSCGSDRCPQAGPTLHDFFYTMPDWQPLT